MNTNDQIDEICKDATTIMVKYPTLFPIVELFSKTIIETGRLKYAIERYSGLRTVAKLKNNAMMELWWSMSTEMYEPMKKVLLKDILIEYALPLYGDNEHRKEWDKMLKTEKL